MSGMYGTGRISAPETQELCHAIESSCPNAASSSFGEAGAQGTNPKNTSRGLKRKMAKQSGKAEVYVTKVSDNTSNNKHIEHNLYK